jgi:hypothetical protein
MTHDVRHMKKKGISNIEHGISKGEGKKIKGATPRNNLA